MIMLIDILKTRFHKHMYRHSDLTWEYVESKLKENSNVLDILKCMEKTGGEPDTIGLDETGKIIYCDCSKETPIGHRRFCYDDEALQKRKKNPPLGSAVHQATEMGVKIMDESLYRRLQELEPCDLKTSSWINTPQEIRNLGGALFCERRYNTVFTFHNGADSYYGVRGWRGYICL